MWIRSQNLLKLVKCDLLFVRQRKSDSFYVIEAGVITLGSYSTLEKALKVLDQIQYNMESFEHEPTMVFQMPENDDVGDY